MLHDFLIANREELVERCKAKVAKRSVPQLTAFEPEHGIALFLEQLITTLRSEHSGTNPGAPVKRSTEIGTTAGKHGSELLRQGFTVDQVVHDYGDLCQAVTEIAAEKRAPVTVDEFRTFNRCLDDAIADAVTEFGRQRDQFVSNGGAQAMNERLGYLAHELRNLLNTAMLALRAIKSGNVALTGATGAVLDRSLRGLADLIDRSLAEVRLTAGLHGHQEAISIREFLDEVQVPAAIEAKTRGLSFSISGSSEGLVVHADRQTLSSAVANLLQNAFKFTRRSGHVSLTAGAISGRVAIEIVDECGGLTPEQLENLFQPFKPYGGDRSGLGLGLSLSRRRVEADGGTLVVRNVPGTGCVFTISLPISLARATGLQPSKA
jgi:signal transduction histidine kinase